MLLDWTLETMLLKAPEDGTGSESTGTDLQDTTDASQESTETAEVSEAEKPWRNPKVEQRIKELTSARYAAESKTRELEKKLAEIATKPQQQGDPNEISEDVLMRKVAEVRFNEESNRIYARGKSRYGDFPSVAQDVVNAIGGYPVGVIEAAMELEEPESVLYHLGKDLGKLDEIRGLSPAKQGAAVARFASQIKKAETPSPTKPLSSAPPPINPVNGNVRKEFAPTDTELPIDTWMKARQNQAKGR